MSYIDTIPHLKAGTLAGYPVYAPLSTHRIEGQAWGHPDFQCHSQNLVLGGGSGAHPGLVVHHFDDLVRLYLLESRATQNNKSYLDSPLEAFLLNGWSFDIQRCFEYCGWGAEAIATLVARSQANGLRYPYVRQRDDTFERWLALSLGSFCFHHLPSLMSKPFAGGLFAHLEESGYVVDTLFFANLVLQPQYNN
jgi:hypothetical protein